MCSSDLPNSGLGAVISYLLKHWERLTLFLRKAGAPLDNNLVERALKKAILHRKNSLFYKTENGARVGDLFMSLIHTAELYGANPVRLSDPVAETCRRTGAEPVGVDALELSRNAGADRCQRETRVAAGEQPAHLRLPTVLGRTGAKAVYTYDFG